MKVTNEKSIDIKQTLQLFWQHVRRYPGYVIGIIISLPVTIFVHQFLPPLIIAEIVNRLSKNQYIPNDLWGSFGWLLVLYAVMRMLSATVLWRIVVLFLWKLEIDVTRDMSQRIFNHLLKQSASFHANRFGGSLVSQATKLTSAYIRFADTTIFQVATLVLSFLFASIILLPKAPIFVGVLLTCSIIYMVLTFFATRRLRVINALEAEAQSEQTGYLADSLTNVMAVKSFAARDYEAKRFAKATEAARAQSLNLMKASQSRELYFSTITSTITVTSLIGATASVVLFKTELAVAFLVLDYTANLVQRLWDFSTSTLRNYNRAFGDAADMVAILQLEPEIQDVPNPEPPRIKKGAIAFEHVVFTHPDAGEALFKDLNLSMKSGEKIGVVGHSGSGKTTLTKLLLRYNDIDSGAILVDGQDIAKIAQDDLRRSIAYVPQEPLLFHRTIRENIAYSRPNATEQDIREAARKAHAHEFIEKLPHGYDTLVGERGVKLSGGQRQRVAIARAILKDAPLLVLDEATSALDSESEKLIQAALWELMKNRTTIVIAHRLSTIQKMDRIIVLDDGKLVEQGSHNDLLKTKGAYASLWEHQSGGFIEE